MVTKKAGTTRMPSCQKSSRSSRDRLGLAMMEVSVGWGFLS
jgi:hypothetical protein